MIQELMLSGVVEERKIPINPGGPFPSSSPSTSSLNSSPSQSSATSSPCSSSENQQQNQLRCPRCDSSNTKFCYYNNYNLTQPRHFCKTCRRYWTKGGALRNVPIGGGCRKTKAAIPSIAAVAANIGGGKPGACRTKPMASIDAIGCRPGQLGGDLEHELLPASPILWATMPHSSHLLALLRASQAQNPNPNPNPSPNFLNSHMRIKEEGAMIGSQNIATDALSMLNAQSLSLDSLGQLSAATCNFSLGRNNNQYQYHQQHQQQNLLLSEAPTSSGIQELYHRLRSTSTANYGANDHNLQVIMNNVGSAAVATATSMATSASTTNSTAMLLEPIPMSGSEMGSYWNPALSWADLPTTNGAFP